MPKPRRARPTKAKSGTGRLDREIRDVLVKHEHKHDGPGHMERVTRERVLEPLTDEHVTRRVPIRITLIPGIGPEPWDLIVTEGRNYGGARAGRILIVLPGGDPIDPLAGIAYAIEHDRPYVHHVWVDGDARRRGLSRILFDAYRSEISPELVIVGPFTPAGRATAERAGATIED